MRKSKLHLKNILKSIASFIGGAMLFCSCTNNSNINKVTSFAHPVGAPEIVGNDVEMLYSDSAVVRFKLNTPILKIYEDEEQPYTEFPEGFTIQQFNGNKKITTSVRADYGKKYDEESLWEARHNVVAVTESGDTLKTELLFWNEKKDQLYSDQFVKIIQEDRIITGVGFESDTKMEKWKIKKPKGTVYVEVEE